MKRTVILLLLCSLLLACVPTPDEDFVPQKDTTAMLEQAKSSFVPEQDSVGIETTNENGQALQLPSLRERYAIPETYQYHADFAEGHFILNVDAKVEVPDTNRIPIVRVERTNFDADVVRRLFSALCGDTEMYYMQQVYSKSQIAERIKYLSEEIADEQAYIKEAGEESLAYVKSEIEQLKKSYADAPEVVEDVRCYGEIVPTVKSYTVNGETKEKTEMGIAALSKDRKTMFSVTTADLETSQRAFLYVIYSAGRPMPQYVECFRVPDDFTVDGYTPEQAEADVNAFLEKVGMTDFTVSRVLYAPEQLKEHPNDPTYWVHCVRTVDAVKTAFSLDMSIDSDDFQYGPIWSYENMSFMIDGSGIIYFTWNEPLKVTDTVVDNATILPFEKIMEIYLRMVNTKFAAQMNITNPDLKYGATTQNQYDIDRIELSLQRIQEPNVWDSALLVPVWNFYGINTRTEVEDYIECNESTYVYNSMMSINAIDGTVIDRNKGY